MAISRDPQKELDELKGAITDVEELYYKGVLYGDFGKRKTTTACRCSRSRCVLLHADRGWHVFRNHDELKGKVIPVRYEGLSQIRALVDAIADSREPFQDVDLLILDTISQMQENYIDFLLENAQYTGNYREKAVAKQGKKFDSVEITGMPDYHIARNKFRPVIKHLVDAPFDVIFLAHIREPSPLDSKKFRRPNVTEAVYRLIARDSTFLGFMENAKGEYTTTFKPTPVLSAKSQITSLQDQTIKSEDLPQHLWNWKDNK